MRFFFWFLILVIMTGTASASRADAPDLDHGEHVETMNMEKYAELEGTDTWLAMKMYAPWCGHCKNMAKSWAELGESLKDLEGVKVVSWNIDKDREAGKKFDISGFPTLLMHNPKTGESVKHKGARSVEAMTYWIKETMNKSD